MIALSGAEAGNQNHSTADERAWTQIRTAFSPESAFICFHLWLMQFPKTPATRVSCILNPRRTSPMVADYVEQREGCYFVRGSRVSLDSIVYGFNEGGSPETIRDNFPSLSVEQVRGA